MIHVQPNDGFPEGQAPVVLDTLSTGEIDYIKYYTKYRNKKTLQKHCNKHVIVY